MLDQQDQLEKMDIKEKRENPDPLECRDQEEQLDTRE